MKFLTLAFMILASPAFAGTLTLSVTTSGGTLTQSVTIPDADIARVVTAYKAAYPQTCDTATPPNCTSNTTNAQVFRALAQGIFAGIKANVLSYEQGAAASSVTSAVNPVSMQ